MSYLQNYLKDIVDNGNVGLAEAVKKTCDAIVPEYIQPFSYKEHVISLLCGNVQSGKTSHLFGLICSAADEGFCLFVLLTTDITLLQQQTLDRVKKDLPDFCICDEADGNIFAANAMNLPVIVVLKKNRRILRKWKNNFAASPFCAGNPIFIVDDEADAASLDTLVNKLGTKKSPVNKNLEEIKQTASSSIYLQVTGTPQALLLQSHQSGWHPYFMYYFEPGKGYIGGNDLFTEDPLSPNVILTNNDEARNLLNDDEIAENGLQTAVIYHLIASADIFLNGGNVSNFLVHPSMNTDLQSQFANKVGAYLNEISSGIEEQEVIDAFFAVYEDLKSTKPQICDFIEIMKFIAEKLDNDEISIKVINSKVSYDQNTQYETGINIIIGGNSLGRGITFPKLQTTYYCRVAKNPQADTMWQHARMFGYDRELSLMRVFMPPILFKLFADINATNNSIIAQIERGSPEDVNICYSKKLRPTRKNVIDNKVVKMFSGGVNYFPFAPANKSIDALDTLLEKFNTDAPYSVNLRLVVDILAQIETDPEDWPAEDFIGFIQTMISENPGAQCRLIVRRERDISKGTGTLLSPNDRALGDSILSIPVLTMYKVTGTKGWDGKKIWIPNIKLPGNNIYYCI